MSPYPPGTTRRDLERGGIIDNRPECRDCGEPIGDGDSHKKDCPRYGMSRNDIAEDREAERAEAELERRRLERD